MALYLLANLYETPSNDVGRVAYGFLWGCGTFPQTIKGSVAVVEADSSLAVKVDGFLYKIFNPVVRFEGGIEESASFIISNGGMGKAVDYATVIVGDNESALVGDYGTAYAGNNGSALTGDRGYASVKNRGVAVTGGYGEAFVGDYGSAYAGSCGKAVAKYAGTAVAGNGGCAASGVDGTILIKYWDSKTCRYRFLVGFVGEGDIKSDTLYHVVNGCFVECTHWSPIGA